MFKDTATQTTLSTKYFWRERFDPPPFPWECDDEDDDFRFYELRYGDNVLGSDDPAFIRGFNTATKTN